MTSLAVALAVDSRGPSALYIVTDSRLTWQTKEKPHWDVCQKTFAAINSADVFGFCGDAFFPPSILRQIVEQINRGVLFREGVPAEERHHIAFSALEAAIAQAKSAPMTSFSVFHGSRDGEFMKARFRVWESRYTVSSGIWRDEESDLAGVRSYWVCVDGSGADYIRARGKEWFNTDAEGTSRAAIWSFCNALHEGRDPFSGGAPQIVGIWRKGPARVFGFRWRGGTYLAGLPVPRAFHILTEAYPALAK
jgi:hypothetical protein